VEVPPRDAAELERRLENITEKLLGAFEELDFVHSLAAVLARPDGIGDLDEYLLRETAAIFRADGGWMARRGTFGRLETTASQDIKPAVSEFLARSLLEPLVDEGALPYVVDDLPRALSQRLQPSDRKGRLAARAHADELPRAFLAAPLAAGTEVLGVICLGKRREGDLFSAGDLKLLSALAIQAGLFIRNADLVRRLRDEAQSLGRRVQQLESDPRRRPGLSWIRGPSPVMKQLARQVEAAAATDATVLLLGESGTGKSLVARILHNLSTRRQGPFVEVNCGAVAPGLVESELFGHARGAFTGADRQRQGLFEEAGGGTILLDEVGELPPESQVKLLTVLEQHRVRRVGENRDRTVDVRVVAATNADPQLAVRQGRFREDLFYRLNVITLTVPPLRQRRDDILPLARRFLEDLARETNRKVSGFSPAAEEMLLGYSWPGNVRELRNVVERSLLLKQRGDLVEVEQLPMGHGVRRAEGSEDTIIEVPLPEAVQRYERRLILDALNHERGVVSRAARALRISRTNLHNKMRKHGLAKDDTNSDASHE
jgi:transcriptional regulator with GAF, ATPase, and Fis domain